MPFLTSLQIARVRKHTGYVTSTDLTTMKQYSTVPNGYMKLFNAAMARDWRQDDIDTAIAPLLVELDELYPQRLPHKQGDGIGYRRLITGDTNRTDIEYRPEPLARRKRAYIEAGNELCNLLGIPVNFKDPANEHLLNKEVFYFL